MKRLLIIVVLILFFKGIDAQAQEKESVKESVKEEHMLLAMLSLFSEGLNLEEVQVNKEKLLKFLSENIGISIIDQKSFKDFVFLSMDQTKERKYLDDKELPVIWSDKNCKEYILAINKGSLYTYKLKGYQNNEFYTFLSSLKKADYSKISTPKSFANNYEVDGLDFECLYKSLKFKKNSDLKKYPCIDNTCMKVYKTHDY